jgi:hypothetical protein
MGPPSYMWSFVDGNVVMRRIPVFRGPYDNPFLYMTICIYLPSLAELSSSQSQALFTKQNREHYLVATFGLL